MSSWKLVTKRNGEYSRTLASTSMFEGEERLSSESQAELRDIYEAHLDIVCGCQSAVMFVRHCSSGRYTLVNHPVKGIHKAECPFFTAVSGEISHREWGGEMDGTPILTFSMHDEVRDRAAPKNSSGKNGNTSGGKPRRSKLSRLLCQLVTESYVNSYYKNKKQNADYNCCKLTEAAESVQFGKDTLNHWIFYGARGLHIAKAKLLRHKDNWEGPGRPHAFLLEVVSSFAKQPGGYQSGSQVHSCVRVVREGNQDTPGPFLLLSSLVLNEEQTDVKRHTTLVKPIVSATNLMPVDSDYERQFAKYCIGYCDNEFDKLRISLTKPVIAKSGDNDEAIIPDFIVSVRAEKRLLARHVVEIMGYKTEEYLSRKERTIPQMKKIFQATSVIEIAGGDTAHMSNYMRWLVTKASKVIGRADTH